MNLKEELQEIHREQVKLSMFFNAAKANLIRAAENEETSLIFYLYDALLIDNLKAEGLTVIGVMGAVSADDYILVTWKNY